jgi:hypothetical protein
VVALRWVANERRRGGLIACFAKVWVAVRAVLPLCPSPKLNHSCNGRAVVSVRATQMRVLEVIGVLETEGEQSVHSDVAEPHQAQS